MMAPRKERKKVIVYKPNGDIVEGFVRKTFPGGRFVTTVDETLFRPDGYGVNSWPHRLPFAASWTAETFAMAEKVTLLKSIRNHSALLDLGGTAQDLTTEELAEIDKVLVVLAASVSAKRALRERGGLE